MIQHPEFTVEPWAVRETALDLGKLAQTESVFALANGNVGLRGNLDEGEPAGIRGTYLAGFHDLRPFPYAEAGYGYPEAGETTVNVADGKLIRLIVQDEPLDARRGTLLSHERVLDMRAGVLTRTLEWRSPAGRRVRVRSTRLVSFTQRAAAAILYEVESLDGPVSIVAQSELVANAATEPLDTGDPRAGAGAAPDPRGAAPQVALTAEFADARELSALMVHRTEGSALRVGTASDHDISGPPGTESRTELFEDLARITVTADITPGQPLRLVKFLAYGWTADRSVAAIRDQVQAALAGARHTGWDRLLADQREYLERFWEAADVEIEGDPELQQAVRFGLFHVLQAGALGGEHAIAAKGLTGPGYDGHAFWDTESFVLPVLTYTVPQAAADALRWRHRTIGLARDRAAQLRLRGAAFPWRTISGRECSGYWPAGTAAFHINADIADAVTRYQAASTDESFAREAGLELLVETARLWAALGYTDAAGMFRINGVTGPDEYSAVADNNVFTNLMAQGNLRAAAAAAERHRRQAAELGVDEAEIRAWRAAAKAMLIPFDDELGIHPQAEGFTAHQRWDFERTAADEYPLMLHFPYFELYRKQVVKQADLVLALHLRGDAFTPEQKARDFDYYERLTVRDSSLSACTQAVIAAELGHLELAYDYAWESALLDLEDLEHNSRNGVHIASLAGTWIAVICGFAGMRDHGGRLSFAPRLPRAITRLAFRIRFRQRRLLVEIDGQEARYSLLAGEPLEISHHGQALTVTTERGPGLPIPEAPAGPAPSQPYGRTPDRRSASQPRDTLAPDRPARGPA